MDSSTNSSYASPSLVARKIGFSAAPEHEVSRHALEVIVSTIVEWHRVNEVPLSEHEGKVLGDHSTFYDKAEVSIRGLSRAQIAEAIIRTQEGLGVRPAKGLAGNVTASAMPGVLRAEAQREHQTFKGIDLGL